MTLGTNTKLTPQLVREIRRLKVERNLTQPQLARMFGVGPAQIGKILRGEAWADVTGAQPIVTDNEAQLRMLRAGTQPATQEELSAGAQRVMALQEQLRQEHSKAPTFEEIMAQRTAMIEAETEAAKSQPAANAKANAEQPKETLKDANNSCDQSSDNNQMPGTSGQGVGS